MDLPAESDHIPMDRLEDEVDSIKDDLEDRRESLKDSLKGSLKDVEIGETMKHKVEDDMEEELVKKELRDKIEEAYAKEEVKHDIVVDKMLEAATSSAERHSNGYDSIHDEKAGYSYHTSETHLVKSDSRDSMSVGEEHKIPYVGATVKERKTKPIICAIVVCLGSFAMGAVIGYPSPAVPDINTCCGKPFSLNVDQTSWIGSIITLTALFGGLVGGIYMDLVGRKLGLLIMTVPLAAGWVIIIASPNYGTMMGGRALTGLIMGVISVICPVYIGEISPPSIRGVLGSCHQLLVCIGILYTYCFGYFLSYQWLVIAIMAFLVLMGVGLCFIVESPRYLLSIGDKEGCKESLIWLRGDDVDVTAELLELEHALEASKDQAKLTEFMQPQLWKPLGISVGLMVFQQFSGINVVMMYTVDIFTMAHLDMDPNVQTIVVGVVGVAGTLVSVFVSDLVGRRVLLIASGALMGLSMVGMGTFFYEQNLDEAFASETLAWLPLTCLVLFNFGFDVAYGPIPWLMMGELFPQRAKGVSSSIATALNWLCAFVMTKFWTNMTNGMGIWGGYWFCAGFCFLSIAFIIILTPETKGKTLEEIELYFNPKLRRETNQ